MASTEAEGGPAGALHPLLHRAAEGKLPEWAAVEPARREHLGRVVALLDEWVKALRLSERDRARWRAAGWLHDSLRDADPTELREWLPASLADVPDPLAHGPAAAARLAAEGVDDDSVLDALRWHTLGHACLDRLGRAVYLADFLEPGRSFAVDWRASLRERMPAELEDVLVEVVAARIRHLVEERRAIRQETLGFWNSLVRRPTRP